MKSDFKGLIQLKQQRQMMEKDWYYFTIIYMLKGNWRLIQTRF